ncbi:SCO5918 family protein [Streptomyces gobiensis]|uniref:SCO5918 family protein n=1 Tax=Streptomyces gobiensis TaxID=2875706 RepID=UPI001E653FC3|nr:SCO5918 family protein [Streptomyces gobiensis]UGY92666.1 SCO5918 family protein [Streptomyces gobiensis]
MRCIIAGYPFDLTASEVEHAMSGTKPESVTGVSVQIGRRAYPVMQVGAVITRQDRRDFTAFEVTRAMKRLGFTCNPAPSPATPDPLSVNSLGSTVRSPW